MFLAYFILLFGLKMRLFEGTHELTYVGYRR